MSIQSLARVEELWKLSETSFKQRQHPAGFPELPVIPVGRYTTEEFFKVENQRLWPRTWLLAGVTDELPSAGSFKALTLNDTPVLLVRGKDCVVRAFYNTCQHRGNMLTSKCEGKAHGFVCPYHGWAYDLEGRLTYIADERLFPGINKASRSLKSIRCESFGNLIFVNLDSGAVPLLEFLGDIVNVLSDMPMNELRLSKKIRIEAPYNWKLAQENFSEAYHSQFVHPGSINPLLDSKAWAPQLLRNGHAATAVKFRRNDDGSLVNLWKSSLTEGKSPAVSDSASELMRISQRNCSIFPNITLSPAEDIFPIITVWPTSVGGCRLDVYFMRVGGQVEGAGRAGDESMVMGIEKVFKEDFEALKGIQASLGGGGIETVRLGWEEQVIYHHSRQLDDVIGSQYVPTGMLVDRVEIQLAGDDC
jgi:phenylpropionate dioxygenase-like ring-hydroxylating dioxygenase large terminal subunit